MKTLINYISEKLVINKNFKEFKRDTIKVNDSNLYYTVSEEIVNYNNAKDVVASWSQQIVI